MAKKKEATGSSRFGLEDGAEFVALARKSIEYLLHTSKMLADEPAKPEYREPRGVFVTLHKFPKRELRGCMGYVEPVVPLWKAIIECAASAAFKDYRFSQVQLAEMDEIIVEVSVLTKPEYIPAVSPGDYRNAITVGEDGLIIEKGARKGLLLPQVAKEYKWQAEEFLQNLCLKAGLKQHEWATPGCRLYKFQAQVFGEAEPRGEVIEGSEPD